MAYVYQHTRLDTNEVFYVGIGKTKHRVYSKSDRNKHWHHIVNKVGYSAQIILDGITWEEACEKEKEFIAFYGRRDRGLGTLVNMTDGGEGTLGCPISEKHKQRVSDAHKGKKLSEELKQKLFNANKGKKLSEEHKQKLSNIQKGRNLPEKVKQKISDTSKGRKLSEKTRKRMSESAKIRISIQCPYCSKKGYAANMKRWHFNNCKTLHN
jgi:hypothetical protein